MFKILPFTYANDETDRILFNTNYSNIQNAVEHEEFYKNFSPWDCFRYYLWQTQRLKCLVSLNSLLRCCSPASWFLDSIITLYFFVYVYLDVLIDQHLSWKRHIDFVSKKISKSVGLFAKARFYLSAKTLMTLYYSVVYLFLTYCNVAWSSTYCFNLNCIYLLQKRIVRLITKAHYLANTAPLFSHLKVLDIFSINSFSVATLIYCNHHNLFVTCS